MSLVSTIANIINNVMENAPEVGENIQEYVTNQIFGGEPEQQQEVSINQIPQQESLPQMSAYTTPLIEPDADRKIEPTKTGLGFENLTSRLAFDTGDIDLNSKPAATFGDESSVRRILTPEQGIENLRQQPGLEPSVTAFESAAKQYRDDNAQRLLTQEQEQRGDFQRAFDEDVINQSFGQMGYDYSQDPFYTQQVENARNAEFDPSGVSEEFQRRLYDSSGNLKSNPLEWNLLGLSSQSQTSPGARAVYESYFDQQRDDNRVVDRGVVNPLMIDDGSNEASREGLYMTGEQYLGYRNAGIPGRDVYNIDPNKLYSKQDEMERYGFIPYLTSDSSADSFKELADMNELNNAFTHLANARRENTDFGVNFEGQQYSGKELQQAYAPFRRKLEEQMQDQESRMVTDPSQASEFAVPHIAQYHITDSSGNVQDFTGEPRKFYDVDGKIKFEWSPTEWAKFDDEDDLFASAKMDYRPANDGEEGSATMWLELDPLTLADGTKVRSDKAQQLFAQLGNEESHDYGPLGWGRQNVESPMEGFLPWITDMALGSAPLFFWPTSIAQAGGQTVASATGMKSGADFNDGSYRMLSDRPSEEQRFWTALGSAAMPFTERMYGNLGSNLLSKAIPKGNFLSNFLDRIEVAKPWQQFAAGAIGEGAEEIPGNFVEELMQGNGPSTYFADELTDENGDVLRNEQGQAIRDPNTSVPQRFHNFLEDVPLSFLGGATLGGSLGAGSIPRYRQSYNKYQRLLEELNGEEPVTADYVNSIEVPLSLTERNMYNR